MLSFHLGTCGVNLLHGPCLQQQLGFLWGGCWAGQQQHAVSRMSKASLQLATAVLKLPKLMLMMKTRYGLLLFILFSNARFIHSFRSLSLPLSHIHTISPPHTHTLSFSLPLSLSPSLSLSLCLVSAAARSPLLLAQAHTLPCAMNEESSTSTRSHAQPPYHLTTVLANSLARSPARRTMLVPAPVRTADIFLCIMDM